MPTATLDVTPADVEAKETAVAPAALGKLGWILMLPLLFFAAHGQFSFQFSATSTGGFSPGAVSANEPGLFGYALAAVTYCVITWLIMTRLRQVLSCALHFKMLSFLALLTVCSVLWSQSPMRSLLHGLFYFAGTLFAYYLVLRFGPSEIMTLILRLGVLSCFLGLIVIVFFPQFGMVHNDLRNGIGWQGIFMDRTTAAKCLVFLLSPALISRPGPWKLSRALYVLLLGAMILMAHSVGSILVLSTYVVFLACIRFGRKLDDKALLVCLSLGSVIVLSAAFAGIEYGPAILKAFGRDPTLTGRTVIWGYLARSILKRPLLGYGYYAFWLGLKGESGKIIYALNWTFGYAHNGVLEVLLQLGFVGVLVFFMTLSKGLKDAWFCLRNDHTGRYDWYLGLLVLTIVYNIDEVTVVLPNDLLSILYVVSCVGLALAVRDIKQYQRERRCMSDGGSLPLAG
ncbi:MAG TPA: O-antigen ligase family protein [Terriglobia bacterium]|nr:O-antigen ligase family protein [Terriglobia bacterium]